MKKMISKTKALFSCNISTPSNPHVANNVDVREEYANAFRTESYNEFWTRVTTLTRKDSTPWKSSMSTTSASRLLSYRLFVEHLLEPNQPTVTKILGSDPNEPENKSLLSDYFEETANASILCGQLLRDTDQMRAKYRSLKKTLQSLENTQLPSSSNHLETILIQLTKFTKYINPFISSSSSLTRFRAVKSSCSELLKRLELRRAKVQAKLHFRNSLKFGSAVFLVALTTTITLVIVTHALATVVAIPGFIYGSLGRNSTKQLAKVTAQLDAAAKGTYILNRDLDTISRLIARLHDELEHTRAVVEFWVERSQDFQDQTSEVVRQLRKNDSSFIDQLDELEEHLYLCFMTINRARNLVVKEILGLHYSSRGK
ncbi:UPF0496 protein At3g49070 [Silene latifolia]|uniref:UPF0496 protein At3g49070 n=1 Tax=Silene latifolia TaxID=37657 RepID=UPI003D76E893